MHLSCESFSPQDDITGSANFMKDYVALVTVELPKFARQIAGVRPGLGRPLPCFRWASFARLSLFVTVAAMSDSRAQAMMEVAPPALLRRSEWRRQRRYMNALVLRGDRRCLVAHLPLGRRPEQLRVEVVPLFLRRFLFFYRNTVGLGVGVLPDAGHLPRHFHVRFTGSNHKSVGGNLLVYDGLREFADYGQLVTEILIQGLEVIGQSYGRKPVPVGCDVAVVDVHHVGRFNERVG
jgi:hypothetical protein